MTPARKRKLGMMMLFIFILSLVVGLVLYALRQNISLFYTPTQIALGEATSLRPIRAGGMVVPGSIVREADGLTVHFKVTDYQHTVDIVYHGILPDLFREGQGIVASGLLIDNQHFKATNVLAKHDEKYMPPEVKDALDRTPQKVSG